MSINEVSTYRDIALTRGHAGKDLGKAKNALRMGATDAARLVDIMRQVRVIAMTTSYQPVKYVHKGDDH